MKLLLPLSFLFLVACASQQQDSSMPRQTTSCDGGLSNEQEFKLNMVEQREKDGQLYAALAALESLPESVPAVMQHKADVLRRLGRPESADYFRRLQKTCLSAWGDHGLGLIAADAGDMKKAQELLQRAAKTLPTEYRLRNDLGVLLLRQKKIEEARFELMTALELSSDHSLPAVNLLTLFMVQQKPVAMRSLMQRYKMESSEWQAAVQSCESLVAGWEKQRIAHLPSEKICTVPSPIDFPVAARTGTTG
ncbi:MAG: tetratricopeptide repeat protein [Pedobacter sp.]|nr:tetratricopeptide repeat protein [Pedobacter sp.]